MMSFNPLGCTRLQSRPYVVVKLHLKRILAPFDLATTSLCLHRLKPHHPLCWHVLDLCSWESCPNQFYCCFSFSALFTFLIVCYLNFFYCNHKWFQIVLNDSKIIILNWSNHSSVKRRTRQSLFSSLPSLFFGRIRRRDSGSSGDARAQSQQRPGPPPLQQQSPFRTLPRIASWVAGCWAAAGWWSGLLFWGALPGKPGPTLTCSFLLT